jgi:hypothetical protein
MKYITCYYNDQDKSGSSWDVAIKIATAGMTPEEKRRCQIICLPESWRKKSKQRQMSILPAVE